MTLICISISLIIGILLGSRLQLPAWSLCIGTAPLLLLFVTGHKKIVITASFCVLALVGGAIRYQSSLPVFDENRVEFYNDGSEITCKGVIASEPDNRDTYTQLVVSVKEVNSVAVTGKILLFVPRYPEYEYGTVLQFTGRLETPTVTEDFDYQGYLAGRGIFSVAYFPAITIVDTEKGFAPLGWLYSTRETLSQKVSEVLPEPQASLAQGIILGIRSEIPQSIKDNFTRTGTTHVLAISGQNLSIVAGMFIATGIWLFGKKHYLYIWLALAATWGYAALTGLDAPVVRAAIMLSLFLFADLLGRQRSVLPALALAAAVMLTISPAILHDASFQLSFVSILGLVLVAPVLQTFGHNAISTRLGEEGWLVSTTNWVIDCLAVTIGVTLLVWPVTACYFGIFSFVSPLATFLILPALAPIIVTCALAAVLGMIVPLLGQAVGWAAWLFLSYMLLVVDWFADLPFTAVDLGKLSPLVIWGYFVIIGITILAFKKKEKALSIIGHIADVLAGSSKRFVIPVLLMIAILSTLFACNIPDDRLHVSFLNVGQGDSILIQQGTQDVLIDGGPSGQAITTELGKQLPFWDRTIELVVLTHPHADHLTGLIEVLKRYKVKQVLYAESTSTSALWEEWQDLLEDKNVDVTICQDGQVIYLGNGNPTIEVLNSPITGETTMDNDGIVLRIIDGKISFLLTADISEEMELSLIMDRANLDCTVLKVAHHGSYTASSTVFLTAASPEVTVISVGMDNDYDHPNQETLERLIAEVGENNIYRTDLNGTIEFITDGERLWVDKER